MTNDFFILSLYNKKSHEKAPGIKAAIVLIVPSKKTWIREKNNNLELIPGAFPFYIGNLLSGLLRCPAALSLHCGRKRPLVS